MKIYVSGTNKHFSKKDIKNIVFFYASQLMSKRLTRSLTIKIKFCSDMGLDSGEVFANDDEYYPRRPKDFDIHINKDLDLYGILSTLAHEMVHVRQYARDQLRPLCKRNIVRFHKQYYDLSKVNYWKCPWEIEAYGFERGLVHLWRQEHNDIPYNASLIRKEEQTSDQALIDIVMIKDCDEYFRKQETLQVS